MKTTRFLLLLACLATSQWLAAQDLYLIMKSQRLVQTSGDGVSADPNGAYAFYAMAETSATLTLPGGSTLPVSQRNSSNGEYHLERTFPSQAELDAAFPSGTYRMGAGTQAGVTLPLTGDRYPATAPRVTSVTNGTWSPAGILIVDPAQPVTLNFSTFSNYGQAAVSHMMISIWGENVEREYAVISQAGAAPGIPVQATPFTSYTLPAGVLTSGRIYEAELDFEMIAGVDVTGIPGGMGAYGYNSQLRFYIGAQSPGTSTPPPVIASQPSGQVVQLGSTVTFTVGITQGGSTAYNNINHVWRLNGVEVPYWNNPSGKYTGSTGPTLRVNNVTEADLGSYTLTLSSTGGVVTSMPAVLALGTPSAPVITTPPAGATANSGSTVALTAGATGNPAPNFQWYRNDVPIPGANTDTLIIPSVSATHQGQYKVVVSNSAGSQTSTVANLQVTAGQSSQLPNLSVRTILAAEQTLTVGFSTQGSKDMLVRAVGPTLGAFGVENVMQDPRIELYNASSQKVDENDNWNPSLTAVFAGRAFPLVDGSRDAALVRAISGGHTARISGTGAGDVLVEVYDTGGAGKLVNVSALNYVGTGANVLTAGFVVQGQVAKTLLIRAVGAKLAEFGVPGVLLDPKLAVYTPAGARIAENDNWNSTLQTVARTVAPGLVLTPGSRDAALVITLSPGEYTAQITGVGDAVGQALVEVYEVP